MKLKKNKTILLVDDEEDIVSMTADILMEEGFDVVTAYDGEAAFKILQSGRPIHMIFSDIRMPKMDGVALLKSVKREFPTIPVCMVSGNSPASEPEVFGYGAVEYLSKPFSLDALISVAHRNLGTEGEEHRSMTKGKMLVYVVEDEIIDQDLLRKSFAQFDSAADVEFKFFFSGEGLIDSLISSQEAPLLIILDINLPGMSGLDTLQKAKANSLIPQGANVIILTSSKLKKDQNRAKDLGVDSYYTKPMDRSSWWHLARAIYQSWLTGKNPPSQAA